MAARLKVSIDPPGVVIGPRALQEQWVEFYALLAIQQREDPTAFVTVDRVHQLTGWALKKPGSVGKEVARHMASLQAHGLGEVVYSSAGTKTKAWRLGIEPAQVDLQPSPPAVAAWLAGRTRVEVTHTAWGQELLRLVEAAVLLRRGLAADAEQALGPRPPEVRDPALMAWRALEEGRAVYMAGDEDHLGRLDALIEAWTRSGEPAGRAVEARLRSYRVMRDRFDDAARTRATLTKIVADLEVAGDAGSLGVMLNVLGVLERRSGNPDRAFEHLTRAAGLLGISGDYHTLQAALYNAALAYRSILKRRDQPADALAFSLLDLCLYVCRELHVGGDTALAEITRADWLLDNGELAEAARQLEQAGRILAESESSYDQAYFLQMRARLTFDGGGPMREVVRDLNASIRIFGEVGDVRAEQRAAAALRRYTRLRRV